MADALPQPGVAASSSSSRGGGGGVRGNNSSSSSNISQRGGVGGGGGDSRTSRLSTASSSCATISGNTPQPTPKKRSVPAAAFGLLRRRDLHLHNFFQRHSQKGLGKAVGVGSTPPLSSKTQLNTTTSATSNTPIYCGGTSSNTGNFSSCSSHATETEQQHQQSPAPPSLLTSASSSTLVTEPPRRTFVDEDPPSSSEETDALGEKAPSVHPRAGQTRNLRRLIAPSSGSMPSNTTVGGTSARGIPTSSSGGHYHLGIGGGSGGLPLGIHARRESFLYRADDREPFFNAAPSLLGCRPISRASSVASSDPQ